MMKFKTLCAGLLISLSTTAVSIESQMLEESVQNVKSVQQQRFGAWLFNGNFKTNTLNGFNGSYRINLGDVITLQLWGGIELNQDLVVDEQGNVFIPRVGPVKVAGLMNEQLNDVISNKIKTVYKSSVKHYVNLKTSQPVKVFVSGFAKKPGLYQGLSSDSLLSFVDNAGGIKPENGSFRQIQIKRNNKELLNVDLYDFIKKGHLDFFQFQDGDVINVKSNNYVVNVKGDVANQAAFEINKPQVKLSSILSLITPSANVTHVRVLTTQAQKQTAAIYTVDQATEALISAGDVVEFVSDNQATNIAVRVEGEHNSLQEYILPKGSNLKELMALITPNAQSDIANVQLFRKSVQMRQQQMIKVAANSLQESVLHAKSATADTAKLRQAEADLILKWVEQAKNVKAKGQVILDADQIAQTILEDGDVIRIPKKSNLVMIHGQVLFPTAVVFNEKYKVKDYLKVAGGLSKKSSNTELFLLARNGSVEKIEKTIWGYKGQNLTAGSEIYALPKVDFKGLQVTKDVVQLVYQVALSAGVVLAL